MARTALRAQISTLLPAGERWQIVTSYHGDHWEAKALLVAEGNARIDAERRLRDLLLEVTGTRRRRRRGAGPTA